jgi:hypothetical protein
MDGKQQRTEWVIFEKSNQDYFFLLDEESLKKISNWENIESELFFHSQNENTNNIKEKTKKELTLNLLTEDERRKEMTNTIINQSINIVNIKISKELIENILNCQNDHYEYRYNKTSDKMHFYIKDSLNKEILKEIINE